MSAQTPKTTSSAPLYKVEPIHRKGLGVIAHQHIPVGTRITCEAPILKALREPDGIDPFPVYEAFESLAPADQDEYMKLSASQNQVDLALECIDDDLPEGVREWVAKIAGIFECNNFEIGAQSELQDDGGLMMMAGVFLIAARVNHSCRPNVVQTWNERIGMLTIHAIRDIEAGEELCDSYILLTEDSETRQASLDAYGFECACEVCGGSVEETRKSDVRRCTVKRLGEDLTFLVQRKAAKGMRKLGPLSPSVWRDGQEDPMNALEYLELLLKEEGLIGHDLAQWYSFGTWHGLNHDLDKSIEWQKKNYDLNVVAKGRDHADTIAAKSKLARMKKRRAAKAK